MCSFTFNWLTLTSEMHFVKFHPGVASCLLSRGKRKYAPLGMRLLWKYINYLLVHHLTSHFCYISKLQKLQRIWSWNFGFANKKRWAFIWYQKIYYFRLRTGGWECDRHKSFNMGKTHSCLPIHIVYRPYILYTLHCYLEFLSVQNKEVLQNMLCEGAICLLVHR